MSTARRPPISSRKEPRQARSSGLVAAVLDAAVQVLAAEGAARFTCARVAERAGVSVGSLYQYFPNKAAILFRLQTDEWRRTTEMLCSILEDRAVPPAVRLRALVHAFVASECEEAQVRVALGDAAPLYRDAPEARQARAAGSSRMAAFVAEALPTSSGPALDTVTELIEMTLNQVAKRFSGTPRTEEAIAVFSDAMADMLIAYLDARRYVHAGEGNCPHSFQGSASAPRQERTEPVHSSPTAWAAEPASAR